MWFFRLLKCFELLLFCWSWFLGLFWIVLSWFSVLGLVRCLCVMFLFVLVKKVWLLCGFSIWFRLVVLMCWWFVRCIFCVVLLRLRLCVSLFFCMMFWWLMICVCSCCVRLSLLLRRIFLVLLWLIRSFIGLCMWLLVYCGCGWWLCVCWVMLIVCGCCICFLLVRLSWCCVVIRLFLRLLR